MVVHSYYLRDGRIRREAETLREAGYSVDVFCLKDKADTAHQIYNGINIFRLPIGRKRGSKLRYILEYGSFLILASISILLRHLKRHYKIIHISTLPDFLVFAGIGPRLLGAKIVLDVHDLMPETFLTKQMGNGKSSWLKIIKLIERKSLEFPDKIITIHEPYANLIATRSGRKPGDIITLMNLADEKIFFPKNGSNPCDENFRMIYSGTVAKRYGVDIAIKAIPIISRHIPNIRLTILGEGENLQEFRLLADNLGVTNYIDFIPPVTIERVPEIISQANVALALHVNDAAFRWSFPQKVHEYVCMNIPVITSRTEVIEYYYKDYLYYLDNQNEDSLFKNILDIKNNPQQALFKAKQAKELFREMNWDHEKIKLVDLMEKLL